MPVQVTLQQLEYFLAAVEHGSLSAAATAMHLSQPSLSEQIKRLESRLGVTLFVRTSRQLVLTEAGRLMLPRARDAVSAAESAVDAVRPMRTLTGGTVSFGTFSSAHHFLLDDLVSQFRTRFPQVRVRIIGRNSAEVADAVRDGTLEAGLVALPIDDSGLEVTSPVWTTEVVYVSSSPERTDHPITIDELVGAPLILPEAKWVDQDPTRLQLLTRAKEAGVTLEPVVEVELPAAAVSLAARGAGDALVSRALVQGSPWTDVVTWAPLEPPLIETFAFVTRAGSQLSPATQEMLTLAAALLRRLPHE